MSIKLTLRYILMVLISMILLVVSGFFALTYIEETMGSSIETPEGFSYNIGSEIQLINQNDVTLSEDALERIQADGIWLQILDEEGYVIDSFNAPEYLANHYTPLEISYMNTSKSYRPNFLYNVGRTSEDILYLVGVPSNDWLQISLDMDRRMVRQFVQMMLILTIIILLIMGFIYSRRIAKPVTKMIEGVDQLSQGNYDEKFSESGLYKTVFARLNQLAHRLKASELERNRTKEQREKWISNISHDLKTPLTSIRGYAEILEDKDYELTPDDISNYSKRISKNAQYMEEMIEELRLNEQLIREEIELKKETVNLTQFIREIIVDISNHPEYAERTIHFQSEDATIHHFIDKNLMRRGLENMIFNALIHNEENTIVTVKFAKKDETILLEIMDDGRGMTPKELEQLFNRYYRGSNTKSYKGTGLGMSIAKEVIEAHNGEINVESEIEKGTKIIVKL